MMNPTATAPTYLPKAHTTVDVYTAKGDNEQQEQEWSRYGEIIAAVCCLFLFLLVVASIAYPFSYYDDNRRDRWWCESCRGSTCTGCGWK